MPTSPCGSVFLIHYHKFSKIKGILFLFVFTFFFHGHSCEVVTIQNPAKMSPRAALHVLTHVTLADNMQTNKDGG